MKQETAKKLIALEIKELEKAVAVIDDIKKTIPKFAGKAPTKRLDTALKAINSNLRFETSYNSFILEIRKENRHVQDTDNSAVYTLSSAVNIIHASLRSSSGDGICQNGTIDAALFLAQVNSAHDYIVNSIKNLTDELKDIDRILAEHARILKERDDFISSTHCLIREYFYLKV